MTGITTLVTYYDRVMSLGDERTKDWPLMVSPLPAILINIAYLLFVKVLGPAFMKNRKPFQLQKTILVYNFFMVGISTYFFLGLGRLTYFGNYNWLCQPTSFTTTPEDMELLNVVWWYLWTKVLELTDTVFFVLRKKYNQVSKLHVVHHSLALWTVWFYFKFSPGGQNAFFPFINCFIHMVMYFYYFLSAMGPSFRKHLWWKKYVTQLQMFQFLLAFIHGCIPIFYDCGYKPSLTFVLIFDGLLFLVLFYDFYQRTYYSGTKKAKLNGEITNGTVPKYHKLGHQQFQCQSEEFDTEDKKSL